MPVYSPPTLSETPTDFLGSPFDPRLFVNGAVISGANRAQLVRVTAQMSGFLRDMVTAFTVSSGNYDIGIFDTGQALAGSRTLLGHSGSTAVPAAETGAAKLTVKWDPGAGVIPIVAGRQYDLAVGIDNVTAAMYRYVNANPSFLPDSYWQVGSGGALPKLSALIVSGFPLATTTEANVVISQFVPFIAGRISAT